MNATITKKQAAILDKKGIPYDPNTSRHEARQLVKLAMNSASKRTRSRLDAFGLDYDPFISQADAFGLIDQHTRQTRALYDELDATPDLLFDLASQTTDWAHVTPARAKGTCPICGHSDFYVTRRQNIGGCHGCSWQKDGQGAGPVGFWAALHGLEWHEATRQLDHAQPVHAQPVDTRPTTHPKQDAPQNRGKWRNMWASILNDGHKRLALPTNAGRLYLESRGIDYATMQAFGVSTTPKGYGPYQNIECCLFPYYHDGVLSAVNKRLTVKPAKKGDKTRLAKGSQPKNAFFGSHAGLSGFVWIVEGEINAMSVWQVLQTLGRSDTVLSVGSEAFIRSRTGEFADRWGDNCVIWCDSPHIRDVVRETGLSCWSTRQDANVLLLAGKLTDCIAWILERQVSNA